MKYMFVTVILLAGIQLQAIQNENEKLPVCEISKGNNFVSGYNVSKGSEVVGYGYRLSRAYWELELLIRDSRCVTAYKRACFYSDNAKGRSYGIIKDFKKLFLGIDDWSGRRANDSIYRAISLGLCDSIIEASN